MRICFMIPLEEEQDMIMIYDKEIEIAPRVGTTLRFQDMGEFDGNYEVIFLESFMGFELREDFPDQDYGYLCVFLIPTEEEAELIIDGNWEAEESEVDFDLNVWKKEYNNLSRFFE